MFLEQLGQKVRAQREKLGLKQSDVANALRVSPQAVSKWERGENAPDIGLLVALCSLLGVTTDWLLESPQSRADLFEATVFVSSVAGAFEKSRHLMPRQFATWANGARFAITETTLGHNAVPVKYLGDRYLCFFSGAGHRRHALAAAVAARDTVNEQLTLALATGQIYLGAMGHPDYAHPDIMGEAVNSAFVMLDWAERSHLHGIVADEQTCEDLGMAGARKHTIPVGTEQAKLSVFQVSAPEH